MNCIEKPSRVSLNPLRWDPDQKRRGHRLMGFSALLLYFEVALIRFIPAHVQVTSYFINLILIASFLGMGVGLIIQARGLKPLSGFIPALVLLLGASQYFSNVVVHTPLSGGEFIYSIRLNLSPTSQEWGMVPVVSIVFVLCTLVFIPLGSAIGQYFEKFPSLVAYSINIFGSLSGLALFSLLSHFSMPPIVWFGLGTVYYLILCRENRKVLVSCLGIPVILFLIYGMHQKEGELWSPYYKINYFKAERNIDLSVNGSFHQRILDLADDPSAAGTYAQLVRQDYLSPYQFVKSRDEVLILGAGTGNDITLALEQNAGHVDAVEIDREIYNLGKKFHFQKPYDDPRVSVAIDDARVFLKKTDKKYDLIIFGTLDSQTLLSGMSSIRLDNYVYTLESFKAAREHLKEDGILILYHSSWSNYISEKIYWSLAEAFGKPPLLKFQLDDHRLFNFTFVGGAKGSVPPEYTFSFPGRVDPTGKRGSSFLLPTDDWPYLYLKGPAVPTHYLKAGGIILLFSVLLVWMSAGIKNRGRPDGSLFFLGVGFLLLETKSVTEMSLLFGSTWLVNVLVFSSILLMILLANLWVLKKEHWNKNWLFGLLILSLIGSYLVPVHFLLAMPVTGQWLVGGIKVALPLFFASMIFALIFKSRKQAALALGYNVIGAVFGGVMEYSAMALGTKSLYLIALIMYLGAYYCCSRESSTQRA
jgi:spermine/spermidine synthase